MQRENRNSGSNAALPGGKKKLRWALVSVVIAGLSIWAVTSQWKGFSLDAFIDYVSGADARWIAAAALGALGFIAFEGCAIRTVCNALRYRTSMRSGCAYAAADIYFSAITPSATGGQPACAFLMMRDGIPGIVTTAVLLLTLAMYALSILVIGALCMLLRARVFLTFATPSRVLILVGFAVQAGLAAMFLMLLKSERLLERLCGAVIHLLARLRILRHEARRQQRLRDTMDEYRQCIALLSGHRPMLIRSFLFNLLQRASQIAVSMLVFLAMGGPARQAADVFAMQSFVVIGSNCVPVPGAMGVADYLMLDGFNAFLRADQVIGMELLSRTLSFYCCVLLCGIITLFVYYRKRTASGK